VDDSATGQAEVSLDRVQFPFGRRQRSHIATEDGKFVEQPGTFDPFIRVHGSIPSSHRQTSPP
jgi:hypothetical protein